MVENRRIRFVIVLDSCCISIGLVFIKDRPVSSFWVLRFRSRVLRFRDLGVFVFEFWVLRFRSRVLRFQVLGASFSRFGCFVLRSSFSKLPTHVISKSCLTHCFLSPLLQEQIQIHRRYSILENLFMQRNQTELSNYKRENTIQVKTSTLRLKILWSTDHKLVTCSKIHE